MTFSNSIERIIEARANVIVAASGGLPQINASGSASVAGQDGSSRVRAGQSDHSETKTIGGGGDASWLIDLFGQYARAKESANASLDAAYADVNVARLAYLSDLTTSYIEARYNQEAYALQQRSLASRRETLKLTNDIKAAGAASSLDVVQAEGLVNSTLAELPGYQTGFNQAANHIATLLGLPATTVTAGLRNGASQPSPRYNTKIGIPADLVRKPPRYPQSRTPAGRCHGPDRCCRGPALSKPQPQRFDRRFAYRLCSGRRSEHVVLRPEPEYPDLQWRTFEGQCRYRQVRRAAAISLLEAGLF